MNDRHLKIYSISEHLVFRFWAKCCGVKEDCREVSFPALDIPEDAEVLSVHHDFSLKAFSFCVRHPSFHEVPEGDPIPTLSGVRLHWKNYFMTDASPVTWMYAPERELNEIKRLAEQLNEKAASPEPCVVSPDVAIKSTVSGNEFTANPSAVGDWVSHCDPRFPSKFLPADVKTLERLSQDVAVHPPSMEEVEEQIRKLKEKSEQRGYEFL